MSKVSSSDYPSYTNSNVSIGGSNASTSYLNGKVSSDYTMSDAQKAIYDYAQNTLANILPQLNILSAGTQNQIQSQLNAYKQDGIDSINDIYTPMITSLENDIASRFGNLDNSIFMDNLDNIESKRSDAVSSLSQDLLKEQNTLEDSALNRQYTYANFLNGLQNEYYNQALSTISSALGSSSSANTYASNLYNTLYKQYVNSLSGSNSTTSALANALGLNSTASLSAFL